MAQFPYRANLSAAVFPFISDNFGQSVIIKGADQNFVQTVVAKADADKDIGIPQIYYCHNVLPYEHGFRAVGYRQRTEPVNDSGFTKIYSLRDEADNKSYFAVTASGNVYLANAPSYSWQLLQNEPDFVGRKITTAYISGITYIYVEKLGCYYYDFYTNKLEEVSLNGLLQESILGIASVFGYLVAYSENSVAWSSTIDPTDFVPNLNTGAGGGSPEGLRGKIVSVIPTTSGMFVFTTANCIPAVVSGNIRFPFNFREVVNTGGISDDELVAYDANTTSLWAYTTAGVQLISLQQTQTQMPAVTDFISGDQFQDFNWETMQPETTDLTLAMKKKLTVISDRYWILSYGVNSLTHALVYDLILQRWGKLRVEHVDCFQWQVLDPGVVEAPKQSIGFLTATGEIKTVDFSANADVTDAVLILGRYKLYRQRFITLQDLVCENVPQGRKFEVSVQATSDGKYGPITKLVERLNNGLLRRYSSRITGDNLSLIFTGNFYLSSLQMMFSLGGRR